MFAVTPLLPTGAHTYGERPRKVTRESVAKAIAKLGERASLRRIRIECGGGSLQDIQKLLVEWKGNGGGFPEVTHRTASIEVSEALDQLVADQKQLLKEVHVVTT